MYGYNYARMEDSKAVGALYTPTKNYYFQRASQFAAQRLAVIKQDMSSYSCLSIINELHFYRHISGYTGDFLGKSLTFFYFKHE